MSYTPIDREALDEMARGARDLARVVKAQFDGFVEVGFTEAQALRLTGDWMRAGLGGDS